MDLLPWVDDSQEIFFSRSKDCTEVVEIWVNRDGALFAKITCPKDRITTISLGKIELPSEIKRLGKKVFKAQSSKWIADSMNKNYPILKFGAGHSYSLSFKLNGKSYERNGKFRL
jgi:hypothetical protein